LSCIEFNLAFCLSFDKIFSLLSFDNFSVDNKYVDSKELIKLIELLIFDSKLIELFIRIFMELFLSSISLTEFCC